VAQLLVVRLLMFAASDTDQVVHAIESNPHLVLAAGGLGLLVAFLFFKPFFDDWSGFWECVKFWFTPDLISLFRGQWEEDRWATMKLFIWLGLSIGTSILAFYQLPAMFSHLFHKTV